jgi:hypothetical protein
MTDATLESLTLLPETQARALLGSRPIEFRVLVPPFLAFGAGELRVLRVREHAGGVSVLAGYERYERPEIG